MAAFLTFAVWLSALAATWWVWAGLVGSSEPARPVINAVFFLFGMFLVWYLLWGEVPTFMHFGPHHLHGFLGFEPQG